MAPLRNQRPPDDERPAVFKWHPFSGTLSDESPDWKEDGIPTVIFNGNRLLKHTIFYNEIRRFRGDKPNSIRILPTPRRAGSDL